MNNNPTVVTKFFMGDFTLRFGVPYAILTIQESDTYFESERLILFETFSPQVLTKVSRVRYPRMTTDKEQLIATEIENIKAEIFYQILHPLFPKKLAQKPTPVNLVEHGHSLLILLRDKFPNELAYFEQVTKNQQLKDLIRLYQSITVEREDMDRP